MKKRINTSSDSNTNTSAQYVYGWCVMASEQNIDNNLIIIYTDKTKPHRGNNGWVGEATIYYGPTNDKSLTEGRNCTSTPILVKMKIEKA